MKTLTLLLSILFALPAVAQNTMSAAEFEAYTTGKTLFYGRQGAPYGAEIYHKNRRVEWSFLDGECKEGHWYEDAGMICFVYEDPQKGPGAPQCWTFSQGPLGLIARFENNPNATELYEAQEVGEEMLCLGPKIGV